MLPVTVGLPRLIATGAAVLVFAAGLVLVFGDPLPGVAVTLVGAIGLHFAVGRRSFRVRFADVSPWLMLGMAALFALLTLVVLAAGGWHGLPALGVIGLILLGFGFLLTRRTNDRDLRARARPADARVRPPSQAFAKRDRTWFSSALAMAWGLIALGLLLGGGLGVALLGIGLCEDEGSSGSDTYCNGGGWEASIIAMAAVVGFALVLPAASLAAGSRRTFRIGLVVPVLLAAADFFLSAIFGAD